MANSLPEVCPFGKPLTPRPIHDSRLTGNAVPSRICPAAVYEKGHGCCDGDFYCTWRGRYLRIVHPPACNGARPSAACILEAT